MVRNREGKLVRRVRPAKGGAATPSDGSAASGAPTALLLSDVAARADCPEAVRIAIEQSVGDIGGELFSDPGGRSSTDTILCDDTNALLSAVAAADAAAAKEAATAAKEAAAAAKRAAAAAERRAARDHTRLRHGHPALGTEPEPEPEPEQQPEPASSPSSTARRRKKEGSVFSRLQGPTVDAELLQQVQDDLRAKESRQRKRSAKGVSPKASALADRLSGGDAAARERQSRTDAHTPLPGSPDSSREEPDAAPPPVPDADSPTAASNGDASPTSKQDSLVLRSPFLGATQGASLGLGGGRPGQAPKSVEETDLLQQGGRTLHPCFRDEEEDVKEFMALFADCGIYTADQLAHTLTTRPTTGYLIPPDCLLRGRPSLLTELLLTCCDKCTYQTPHIEGGHLQRYYQRLLEDSNRPALPRGAPVLGAEPVEWISPQLALALCAVERLDLQAALVRAGVTTPTAFLSLTEIQNPDETIFKLPINQRLQSTGDRILVSADVEKIRKQLVPPRGAKGSTTTVDGCTLTGTEGVEWSLAPSTTAKGVRTLLRQIHSDEKTGDVVYIAGQIPLVIGVQCGSTVGGNVAEIWQNQGNHRLPRWAELAQSGRGTVALKTGQRVISERGDVRATLSCDLSADAREIKYTLDATSRRDFGKADWVFESNKTRWEKVRQMDDPIAFWRLAENGQIESPDGDGEEERMFTISLVDALADRFVETVGGCPHIVLCRLDLDKVVVSNSLSAAVGGLKGAAATRSKAAWMNYHTLVEVAKTRMTTSAAPRGQTGETRRGGCGLFVELHAMEPDAPQLDGPVQLGYGLRPFEVRSIVTGRQPAGSRIDNAAVLKAFNVFDRDGSGAIDRQEFAAAVKALQLDMTQEDLDEAMREIDCDGSGEIDKKEFTAWFAKIGEPEEGGLSRVGEIRGRTMIAGSLLANLGSRMRHEVPSAALVGPTALGTLLEQYGLSCVPCPSNVMPFRVSDDYQGGRFSVEAHSTPAIDAVEISLPQWIFIASAAELAARADDAFAAFDSDGSGDIDGKELARLAHRLRCKLDDEGIRQAMLDMTGDPESEVVEKEQFIAWYQNAAADRGGGAAQQRGKAGLDAAGIAQKLHLRRSAARLADGLAGFLALNFGFCTLPGSGSRRGPPRLMTSQFVNDVQCDSATLKADGTLNARPKTRQ